MTYLEILHSAWHHQLMLWSNEKRRLAEYPDNKLICCRCENYWKNSEELHERILKLENEKIGLKSF